VFIFDRIDYLKKHKLKNFGGYAKVLDKKPSDLPPSGPSGQHFQLLGVKSTVSKSPAVKILTKSGPKQLKLDRAPKAAPSAQKSRPKIVMGCKSLVLNLPAQKKVANVRGDRPKNLPQLKTTRTGQAPKVKQTKSPRNSRPGNPNSNSAQTKAGTSTNRKKIAPSQSPARRIPQPAASAKIAQSRDVSGAKKSLSGALAVPKQKSVPKEKIRFPASKFKPSLAVPRKK
jgi:hypothetical protein